MGKAHFEVKETARWGGLCFLVFRFSGIQGNISSRAAISRSPSRMG